MGELHQAVLSLGSNIEPDVHLPRAIRALQEYGQVEAISSAWESHAIGSDGPNFLNACVTFLTDIMQPSELKERVIRPIEARQGRMRGADKFAPRTIDLDILLFDGNPLNVNFWEYAFVVVPLAELLPDFEHPTRGEKLSRIAGHLQSQVWIVRREDVIITQAS